MYLANQQHSKQQPKSHSHVFGWRLFSVTMAPRKDLRAF